MTKTIKMVICDDHFLYRKGIRNWLEKVPNIDIIGESENGLHLLKSLKHISPDVILLDINMPVMDGYAALKEIKREYPHIKVIMLTMNDSHGVRSEMFKLGANAYLTKNEDPEAIQEAIISCINTGYFFRDKDVLSLVDRVKNISHETFTSADTPVTDLTEKPNKINYLKILTLSSLLILLGVISLYFILLIKNNLSNLNNITLN